MSRKRRAQPRDIVSKLRRKEHRRRQERRAAGRCGKRQWRDLDAAKRAVAGSLAHPDNPTQALAIYVCSDCGWYHQSRCLDGPDTVVVLERVADDQPPATSDRAAAPISKISRVSSQPAKR